MVRLICLIGFMTLVVFMMLSLPAGAQVDADGGDDAKVKLKYFDFFVVKGGPIAYGLIALSIVVIALTIEHCLSIRRATIVPSEATDRAGELVDDKEYLEAIKFTADDPSMIGHVVNAGLVEAANGFAAMERALEETLEERSARLFRKIEYLNMIGNVSPMIGLLGTVTGMIMLFAKIHAQNDLPPARELADTIAVALITTFWGLAVAIPALSIYAAFRNRIDVLTAECALSAERILTVFKPGSAAQAAGSRAQARSGTAPSGKGPSRPPEGSASAEPSQPPT